MENYSSVIFKSGPVQTSDYVNNRYNVTHEKLYKNAINALIVDIAKTELHKMFILGISKLTQHPGEDEDPKLSNKHPGEYIDVKKYIDDYIYKYRKTHRFLEIKQDEYFKPSSVISIGTVFPYERKKYDLTKYWNMTPRERNNKDISLLQLDEDTVKYAELIYIDYVQGKCKFKSKLTGEEFWTTFDYINDETKVSELYSLSSTFAYKIQNKIFEE